MELFDGLEAIAIIVPVILYEGIFASPGQLAGSVVIKIFCFIKIALTVSQYISFARFPCAQRTPKVISVKQMVAHKFTGFSILEDFEAFR